MFSGSDREFIGGVMTEETKRKVRITIVWVNDALIFLDCIAATGFMYLAFHGWISNELLESVGPTPLTRADPFSSASFAKEMFLAHGFSILWAAVFCLFMASVMFLINKQILRLVFEHLGIAEIVNPDAVPIGAADKHGWF
jgi:hypothetical protein